MPGTLLPTLQVQWGLDKFSSIYEGSFWPIAMLLFAAFTYLSVSRLLRDRTKVNFKARRILPPPPSPPPPSGDALQYTIHALKSTSLATRAGKMGTATLRNLWKLNNPFTSDSYELQQAYRQELVQKFSKMNSDSWVTVARTVADSLMPLLVRADNTVSCNVKNISRHVTLAAVLTSLFDINEVETERLAYIGDEIHRLTVGKKQYDAGASTAADLPLDMQQAAERLIENLRDLFADAKNTSQLARTILCSVSGTTDDFNPLNLVIPAFEAPWRAIYYTLLAILQSDCQARIQDITALLASEPQSSPHPAVLAVMYESLRMYPPIRRVRRDHRVDIEAIQRDTKYWGGDADTFDPRRFLDNCGRIKTELIGAGSAWMPFAVGSMKCPSAGGYSARFMVVVISEVLRQLFLSGDKHGQLPNWRLDGPEWDHAAKSGQALRSGRDEYASVRLIVYP